MQTAKNDSVRVSKLIVAIGKAQIPLTVEQAKELHRQLDELFGKAEPAAVTKEIVIHRDYWPWWQPWTYGEQHIEINYGGTSTALPMVQCCAETA